MPAFTAQHQQPDDQRVLRKLYASASAHRRDARGVLSYLRPREHHEYELYLAVENIDHSRTKARHPQTNGICGRFHRTIRVQTFLDSISLAREKMLDARFSSAPTPESSISQRSAGGDAAKSMATQL